MASVGAFSEAGEEGGGSGSGAPTTATYIVQTPDATLSAEQALSALATGILFSTTTTGVVSILTVGSGLTLTVSTLANDLITGKAGGQVAIGGTAANETLSLQGSSHATPGKVISLDPFVVSATTSLTSCAVQVNGDPNTGIGQTAGADTLTVVTGGAERVRVSNTNCVFTGGCNIFMDSSCVVKLDRGTVSLASPQLQFQGDANTGLMQNAIADTVSLVGGGIELLRAGPDVIVSPAGALATNATTGFLRLPTCAGTPTGAATNGAMVLDTTGSKLWLRIGGAWVGGTVPGAFV